MKYLKLLVAVGIAAGVSLIAIPSAHAQTTIQFGVGVGPGYVGAPPVCPYGYYDYYPYQCAPYGFYGPTYFSNGIFIGVGPWRHGYYDRRGFFVAPPRRVYGRPGFNRPVFNRPAFNRGFAYRDRNRGFIQRGAPARSSGNFNGGSRAPAPRGGGNFQSGRGFSGGSRGGVRGGAPGGNSRAGGGGGRGGRR